MSVLDNNDQRVYNGIWPMSSQQEGDHMKSVFDTKLGVRGILTRPGYEAALPWTGPWYAKLGMWLMCRIRRAKAFLLEVWHCVW